MKWSKLLLGMGVGAAAGYFLSKQQIQELISPEKALKIAKEKFKEKWPIDGSWIHMVPETVTMHDLPYKVYRGGITRSHHDGVTQYEFLVDAKTGSVLDLKTLS